MPHVYSACKDQRKMLEPLEVEWGAAVGCLIWVMGTESGSLWKSTR